MKKALLVGINNYRQPGSDLRGCVNDVVNMRKILNQVYKFPLDNIRVITDDRATQVNILERLNWLIDTASYGDELVFHYSGHGCFSGDTEIKLLDGTTKTLKELEETHKNKEFWVYSCNGDGEIVPGKAHSPRITKTSKVMRITLDNGEKIICTPDHKFMLRNGKYSKACELGVGTSLMPLYTKLSNKSNGDRLDGYELVYVPNPTKLPNGVLYSSDNYYYTHQIVGYNQSMLNDGYKGVLHHIDFNKLNNAPNNLKLMTRSDHSKIHAQTPEHKEKSRKQLINYNKNIFPKKIKEDAEFRKKFGEASSKAREKDWKITEYREKVSVGVQNSYKKANHIRWHVNRGIVKEECELCIKNHKVVNIEYLNIEIPVYDITVEKYHNFGLASGVFVHNSQVRDRNGDELRDHVDEILCPHDMNWGNPFTDDLIASIFKRLPDGVNLTMVCDACHSGSMTRSFFENPEGLSEFSMRDRFLVPPIDIQARAEGRGNLNKSNMGLKQDRAGKSKEQNHILFSGCQDDQTSADAYINGKFQGAMTATLIRVINENPDVDWRHVHKRVNQLLDKAGFSQNPVLSGNNDNIKRKLFGGV